MNTDMSLENFDTSDWLTKDKAWMEERKAQWPTIERVVGLNRRKTEVNVIKQYFLRGKLPKWEKYSNWKDIFRPLDLNIFLWLYPSDDPEILKAAYYCYIGSDLVDPQDIIAGYGSFLGHELMTATAPYKSLEEYPFPFMGDKNIILFRIMFEDLEYAKDRICHLLGGQELFDKEARHVFEFQGYHHFLWIRGWLIHDSVSLLNINCLYQYDDVLEWSLTTMATANKESEFINELKKRESIKSYQKALYCLYNFDTKKEGDTCRAQFVYKIRKILDEREFIPEFKQIWEDVKAGKVEVKNPWKY